MMIEDMLGMLMGRLAQGLRGDDPVSRFYLESLQRLFRHTVGNWSAVSATGLRCSVDLPADPRRGHSRSCPLPAAGPCAQCDKLVCLAHAMVTPQSPVLLCATCVARQFPKIAGTWPRAAGRPSDFRAPDATAELRQKHLRTMGLGPEATTDEIREAQRRHARRHHPDRQRDAKKRLAAEKRMKAINEAASWLLRHEEAAA